MDTKARQRQLKAGAGLVIATGIMLALGAHPGTGESVRLFADLILWPLDGSQTMPAEARLLSAISGGVLAGWGVMLWGLAGRLFETAPDLVRRLVVQSAIVWFVVDGAGSVAAGAPLNLIGNAIYLAVLLLPFRPGRNAPAEA